MNTVQESKWLSPFNIEETCAKFVIDDVQKPFIFHDILHVTSEYTVSFWIHSTLNSSLKIQDEIFEFPSGWTKYEKTFIADDVHLQLKFLEVGTYYIYQMQLELGNKATDWTPAPEDVDASITAAKEAAIQISSDTITSTVRSMEIGGRNLLPQTQEFEGLAYAESLQGIVQTATTIATTENYSIPGYVDQDGVIQGTEGYVRTDYINVSDYESLKIHTSLGSLEVAPVVWYTNDKTFISSETTVITTETDLTYTVPSDAVYAIFSSATSTTPTVIGINTTITVDDYNTLAVRYLNKSADTEGYSEFAQWGGIYPNKLGQEYTFSFYAKGTSIQVFFYGVDGYLPVVKSVSSQNTESTSGDGAMTFTLSNEWKRYWVTWKLAESGDISIEKYVLLRLHFGQSAQVCGAKLELGNKATDWTPAPEDVGGDLEDVRNIAEAAGRATVEARSLIEQLKDSIEMLVTDANGTSLMKQTANGWTFSTGAIEENVKNVSDGLGELLNSLENTDETVTALKAAVENIPANVTYVRIGTYTDVATGNTDPCIILGESESDFKLRITHTAIQFIEGDDTSEDILAYISNSSLHIKKAVIDDELVFGGFSWYERANGNMGIIWKGVVN